jgi:hypothetical protein
MRDARATPCTRSGDLVPKHRTTPVRNWFRRQLPFLFPPEPSGGSHAAWEAPGIISRARHEADQYIDDTEPNP